METKAELIKMILESPHNDEMFTEETLETFTEGHLDRIADILCPGHISVKGRI